MNRFLVSLLLAVTSSLTLGVGSAVAAVTVNFTQPDHYIDMPFAPWEKERVMKDLREHFNKLGEQLPSGQDLKIDIVDIDLAGRIEPNVRFGQEIRVMRGRTDWPAITLRYSIESQGKVLRSGDLRIDDKSYLDHINRYSANEPLRYEKRMLDDWFKTVMK